MVDYSIEQINAAFNKLPKNTGRAIDYVGVEEKKKEITDIYKNIIKEPEFFDSCVTYVLIGLMNDIEFETNIKNDFNLSDIEAKKIFNDVNNKIFRPVFDKKNILDEEEKLLKTSTENEVVPINTNIIQPKEVTEVPPINEAGAPSKNISPDSNFQTKIYEIGRKYGLLIDQIGKLDEITNKVISGDISSARYEDELRARLAISPDLLANIIKDVNEQIFNKIRQSIRNYFENKENDKNDLIEDDIPIPPYKEKVADVPSNLPIKEEPKIIPQEKDPSVSNNTEQKNKETETIVTQPKELPTGIEITPIDENMGQIKEEKQASTPQENQIPMTANPISTQTTLAPNPTPNNPNNSVFAKTGIEILDTTSQSGFDPYKEVL